MLIHEEQSKVQRRDNMKILFSVTLIIGLALFVTGFYFGTRYQTKYFYDNSQEFLGDYKLDIPEEIRTVAKSNSDSVSLLMAFRIDTTKTIVLMMGVDRSIKDKKKNPVKNDIIHQIIYKDYK